MSPQLSPARVVWRRVPGDTEEHCAACNDFPPERLNCDQLASTASTRGPVRHVCPPQAEDIRLVGGALIAGRPGSSESQRVRSLAWEIGPDVEPARVHGVALEVLDEVLTEWVTGDVVVEVAETLASILGQVVTQNVQRSPHASRYANYATSRGR